MAWIDIWLLIAVFIFVTNFSKTWTSTTLACDSCTNVVETKCETSIRFVDPTGSVEDYSNLWLLLDYSELEETNSSNSLVFVRYRIVVTFTIIFAHSITVFLVDYLNLLFDKIKFRIQLWIFCIIYWLWDAEMCKLFVGELKFDSYDVLV